MEEVREQRQSVEIGGHPPLHGEIIFSASSPERTPHVVQTPEEARMAQLSSEIQAITANGPQEIAATEEEVLSAVAESIPAVAPLPRRVDPEKSASWLAVFQKRVAAKLNAS